MFPDCMEPCSCPSDGFNPVCDPRRSVEYLTPCHAGCTSWAAQETLDKSQVGQATGCPFCLLWALPFPVSMPTMLSTSECSQSRALLSVCLCLSVSFCWEM